MSGQNIKKRKIGIMGGTFDPVHYGHLMIAENARTQFGLEEVWFIPTGPSPHKEDAQITDGEHRCAMLRLGLEGNDGFVLSTREVESKEVCYTYKTLQILQQQEPETDWHFIMGADSLFQIESWKNPEVIFACATLLVAVRDDMMQPQLEQKIAELKEQFHCTIYPMHTPSFSVSSHDIRHRVAKGESIRYQLPETVRQYIAVHGLYQ